MAKIRQTEQLSCDNCSFKNSIWDRCSIADSMCVHANECYCECEHDYCDETACEDYEPCDKDVL